MDDPGEPPLPEGFHWAYLLGTRTRRADGSTSDWRYEQISVEPRRRRTFESAVRAAELFNHRSADEEQRVFRIAVGEGRPQAVDAYEPEVLFGNDPAWSDARS